MLINDGLVVMATGTGKNMVSAFEFNKIVAVRVNKDALFICVASDVSKSRRENNSYEHNRKDFIRNVYLH